AFIVEQQVSREIVQHAPIGIIQMEADFKIKDINPVFRSYLAEEENIDGLSLWQLLPELPRDELTNTVASGKPAILKDVGISQIGSRTDLERYWDLAAWPMMEGDKVRSLILLIEDMSDKTILSRQKEVLQQTIAHDLKSPLIASNYLIQAMMKKHAKNGDQELLMRLQDSNEDALKMVKNMLEVSKYRQGVHVMAHSEVVLNDLVNNIVSGFDFRCQVSEVSIALILPNERIQIQSDEAALKHLVGNLLENAIKFSPRQTAVTITLKQQDDQVSIDVHNSGPGIHEKDKEKLFTPFWQGELGQQSAGGTGIGLYLSQQIAHALGGTISFTSDELSGTTFTITLPSKPKVTNGAQK
ncbi:MAG TPA: HAMP domain-containing histidine kinase, partial [Candidatus Obscuribacterales bacterium]|nr:HAMP domain-containing histidine kinase [Candidatus Obscuribacterales bacterium]